MIEEWKDIEGYTDYMISNLGRVKSCKYGKERIMKTTTLNQGYEQLSICKYGKQKTFKVHRLVAEAFIPNPDNKSCIDHINTNRSDNRVENLRWVSEKENCNNPLSKIHYSECRKGSLNYCARSVFQFNMNMELIRKWDCISDVKKELGLNHSHISVCCSGKRKTANGYKWGYVEDYELIPFKVFDLKIYKKRSA